MMRNSNVTAALEDASDFYDGGIEVIEIVEEIGSR